MAASALVLPDQVAAHGRSGEADLARPGSLVSADWLLAALDGAGGGERLVTVVDVSGSTVRPSRYADEHIPGAICVSTDSVESEANEWNLFSGAELGAVFAAHGIRGDAFVVVTSEDMQAAARMWMALNVAGIEHASVLDGGNAEWRRRAFPCESVPCRPPAASPSSWAGRADAVRGDLVLGLDALPEANDPASVIVSTRSYAEFCGLRSGYEFITATGELPGAVWGRCGSDAHHMEDYTDSNGCMKPLDVISRWWTHVGATPDKHVVFYCGTGWRASYAMLMASLLGYPHASLFDGGWLSWTIHRQ